MRGQVSQDTPKAEAILEEGQQLLEQVGAGRWPRYPEYKDSGINWLGKIPSHWKKFRFRFLLHDGYYGLKIGPFGSQIRSEMLVEEGFKIYGQENVINKNFEVGRRFITEEKFQELYVYEIKPGDLLVTMMGTSGRCEIVPGTIEPGIMDSHLIRLRTKDSMVNRRFLQILIDEADYVKHQIQILGKGSIMHGLNSSIIKELNLVFPDKEEQTAILSFLDQETARIDELIAKKQRLIELLQEKRTALISQAVTKGLNPNAPMKDSGIDWLGEIPKHWDVVRVKWVSKLESGHTPSKQVPEYWEDCDIPWVSLNDSKQLAVCDYITETKYKINSLGLENSSARILPSGAVVFTRDATIGLTAITTQPMAVSQHLIAWIPGKKIRPEFLLRVFNVMKGYLDSFTFGATIKTIGMPDVKKLFTPLPPLKEQEEIENFIRVELKKHNNLLKLVKNAIESLQEYRSALISAAVTGKIDVRQLATEPVTA